MDNPAHPATPSNHQTTEHTEHTEPRHADPPEPFPFGTAFRAVCIVVFVVTFVVGVIRETRWGLDSEKIMVFGGLAIALFFVSLWFSELRCG